MLIKYYKNSDLTYSSRKRYRNLPNLEYIEEEQKSVLFGDGSITSIKTNSNNICDYVTIDNTRWFVTSYKYLNGGQVELFLQRDVIGEFGLDNCYGKIERGHTDTILKRRKELNLNQILKNRIPLIPQSNKYGNYYVDNHNDELWGVVYITKPSTTEQEVVVNIPSFRPTNILDLDALPEGYYNKSNNLISNFNGYISFRKRTGTFTSKSYIFNFNVSFKYQGYNDIVIDVIDVQYYGDSISDTTIPIRLEQSDINTSISINDMSKCIKDYLRVVSLNIINNGTYFVFPSYVENLYNLEEYNNSIIKETINEEDVYYEYYYNIEQFTNFSSSQGIDAILENAFKYKGVRTYGNIGVSCVVNYNYSELYKINCNAENIIQKYNLKRRLLTNEEQGSITIDLTEDLIDEPYIIYIIPLYNVLITRGDAEYDIDRAKAFNVFNNFIQALSGENAYLVDAQVYPYCPNLATVSNSLNGIPFFTISGTSFERDCVINLNPYEDIKKEYIAREYSIVSPDQTDKFSFNFYDYKLNKSPLKIEIKTALKPFSIISSAVLIPDNGSLMNITYDSDLRGCQPSSNGFEVSISTNAFQQYVRNNSNYQNIFNKNQEYLKKQQDVERVNEKTQAIVNTLSATAMGAIGGSALGGIAGKKGAGIGAGIGATVAATTVGIAMGTQYQKNEELREYEYNLQEQMFDLNLGTIKNLPNTLSRISSFNEIILKDFWFIIEIYECSDFELSLIDNFINMYGYGLGVYDFFVKYIKQGGFIRGNLITSNYITNLHNIANNELKGGIYYYGN